MRTDSLNTLDEASEGPHETACIRMQSRLHGEVLVGFLVPFTRTWSRVPARRLGQPVAAEGQGFAHEY